MYYVKGHVNFTTDEVKDLETTDIIDDFIASNKLVFETIDVNNSMSGLFVRFFLKHKINVEKIKGTKNFKYNIDLWFIDETDAGFTTAEFLTEVHGENDFKHKLLVNPPAAIDFVITKKKAEMKKWLETGFDTDNSEAAQPELAKSAEKVNKTAKPKKISPAKCKKFLNNIQNSEPEISHLPLLLALINTDMKTFSDWDEEGLDDSLDYLLEAVLEHLTSLLQNYPDEFRDEVETSLISLGSLMEIVRDKWLQLKDVSGSTAYEINVRAAEFLGECSRATGETPDVQFARIKSDDWHIRMWGARAIRAIDPPNLDEILASLQSDTFEDDNGNFLVREAAGFLNKG